MPLNRKYREAVHIYVALMTDSNPARHDVIDHTIDAMGLTFPELLGFLKGMGYVWMGADGWVLQPVAVH